MLTYTFDDRGDESLYAHLYHCLRADIESGVIGPDEKLPSKRPFAKHLGVSLITVEGAYTQLLAEGYIRSVPRVGYFANWLQQSGQAKALPGKATRVVSLAQEPRGLLPDLRPTEDRGLIAGSCAPLVGSRESLTSTNLGASSPVASGPSAPAQPSLPSFALSEVAPSSPPASTFPLAAWSRTLREVLSRESEEVLTQQSPSMGLPRLQKALAQYVRAFRGLDISPEQILIASGAQTIYNLLIQLNGRQAPVAVESPGYPRLVHIYRHNEVPLCCVGLDEEGVDMVQLRASGAQGVHLMPSHQYPTGIVTPISRRYELLSWATEESGRFIIEDDYDCEFRLTGRPIPPMKSIDTEDCVIYTNTFTRSLGPSFRVGFAVLPRHLVERYHRELGFYSCTVSTIEQITLARFIESGDLERHINRVRTQCRMRRDKLQSALEAAGLHSAVTLRGAEAGLHFLLTVPHECPESQIVQALHESHIAAMPLSRFYVEPSLNSRNSSIRYTSQAFRAYVVSYADLSDTSIRKLVEKLGVLLKTTLVAKSV